MPPIPEMECVRREYCISVNKTKFERLLKRESFGSGYPGEKHLHFLLENLDGVSRVEYCGHFGPNIFLRIDSKYDTESMRASIILIVMMEMDRKLKG